MNAFLFLADRWIEWGWFGVILAGLDAVAVVRAVLRGHGVTSTLAWLFAILAFPGLGATVYLLLANPSVGRTVRKKIAASTRRHRRRELEQKEPGSVPRLAESLTGVPTTQGNCVELLVEDETAFARIEDELRSARQSIRAEYYIVRNDDTGHRFLELLAARARAGVSVHLLYDAVGSVGLDTARLGAIRAAGGRAEPFLPMNPFRRRWSVHLRNHRKLIIVDGAIVFTGGMNVGDEYSGRSKRKGAQHFRDSHLRIEGPAARYFAEIFAEDWKFAVGEQLDDSSPEALDSPRSGTAEVCPLPSGPDQEWNTSALTYFAGITGARKNCFLTTPYFVPDEPTLTALVTAAKAGVDVRLLLPERCDVPLVAAAARSFYRELLRGGVRIFEYRPSMLHAKTMSVDDRWGIVSSANVDMRSFRLNFELGALVNDEKFTAELSARFLGELADSQEITLAHLARLGLGARLTQGAARLLAPLL